MVNLPSVQMENNNSEINRRFGESSQGGKGKHTGMAGLCFGPIGLWVFTGCLLILLATFVSYVLIESRGGAGPLFLEEVVDNDCPDPYMPKSRGSSGWNNRGVSGFGRILYGEFEGELDGKPGEELDGKLDRDLDRKLDGERREKVVRLAGSGSNLPLTNRLAAEYMRHHPGRVVLVHQSIGSGGGVRALKDGRIRLALVSRPLSAMEKESSLRVFPYAKVAVVLAAHPTVTDDGVTFSALNEIYSGRKRRWSNGARIMVIQRERGDSSHLVVSSVLTGFEEANEEARRRGLFREVFTDAAMRNSLLYTQGAVGLYDYGAIISGGLPLKVLSIDGVTPEESLGSNSEDDEPARRHIWREDYPLWKDFAFVGSGRLGRSAELFMEFVFSPAGRRVIEENGYVPLYPGGEGVKQEDDSGR